jgi:hypothetical protein
MVADVAHVYDAQCPCPACRARATREWMLTDDLWMFEFGAWQSSPWNVGGAIAAAVAELDERSRACIELYYVLGVGLPVPRSYPDKYPEEIEAMIRHQAWTADDGWGDTGVAEAFRRAVAEGRMAEAEGGYRWVLSARRWGQIRHAAIGAIVRRVTGG